MIEVHLLLKEAAKLWIDRTPPGHLPSHVIRHHLFKTGALA
jgi:hypothetical protein